MKQFLLLTRMKQTACIIDKSQENNTEQVNVLQETKQKLKYKGQQMLARNWRQHSPHEEYDLEDSLLHVLNQ